MLSRTLTAFVALVGAVTASQLPEFTQQYRQRIGGAIDELRRIVQRFDDNARREHLDRAQALARKRANPDTMVRREADDTERDIQRLGRLENQRVTLADGGPITRVGTMVAGFDRQLLRETYREFQPAVPVTTEGFMFAATGFVTGWLAAFGLGASFRRWRARRAVRAANRTALANARAGTDLP